MENLLLIMLIVAIIIILLLCYYLYQCRKRKNETSSTPPLPLAPHVPFDTTQILLWKKPGVSTQDFNDYIKAKFPDASVSDLSHCKGCDDSLVLVSNVNAPLFIAGQFPPPPPPKPPVAPLCGGDGPAYFSPNFFVEFKDNIDRSQKRNYCHDVIRTGDSKFSFSKEVVTVAVFDTGIDDYLVKELLYQNEVPSCIGTGGDNGWNFADYNNEWKDDFENKHGSIVAKLIADQAYQYGANEVRILPVKVHNKDGVCRLSDVLCALQYAKNRGADIINASFGFYAPIMTADADNTAYAGSLLFEKFLQDYFKNSRILMVAAAGNKDDPNEDKVYQSVDPVAKRNLNNVSFYPASFAATMQNVIAVTTASAETNTVSPHQNFSADVVDIGVETDLIDSNDPEQYLFYHPFEANSTVEGSSFAAPIVTGKIAANYYRIKDLPIPLNKETIFNTLMLNMADGGALIYTNPDLPDDLIKEKRMMNK